MGDTVSLSEVLKNERKKQEKQEKQEKQKIETKESPAPKLVAKKIINNNIGKKLHILAAEENKAMKLNIYLKPDLVEFLEKVKEENGFNTISQTIKQIILTFKNKK